MILIDVFNFDAHASRPSAASPVLRDGSNRIAFGRWILKVRADAFTENVTCSLEGSSMTYEQNAVVFQFARKTRTFDAVYRIDGGQPRIWRTNLVKLLYSGVSLQTDDVTNPDGGRVVIPWDELKNAKVVEIKPNVRSQVSLFRLEDLKKAREAANKWGCGPAFQDAKNHE